MRSILYYFSVEDFIFFPLLQGLDIIALDNYKLSKGRTLPVLGRLNFRAFHCPTYDISKQSNVSFEEHSFYSLLTVEDKGSIYQWVH